MSRSLFTYLKSPMIKINFIHNNKWPKLSWVAEIKPLDSLIVVYHGPMVEVGDEWAVEGVWDGSFPAGDFDKSDAIYGTGIRRRGDEIIFVNSSTGVDRLWYVEVDGISFVGNTLPGILKITALSLRLDYRYYCYDISSVQSKGIYSGNKKIPTTGPNLNIVYYNNIVFNGSFLKEVEKPNNTPILNDYSAYSEFLCRQATLLKSNSNHEKRRNNVEMLVGISSGYDSIAAAVIAKKAGCNESVSIVNPSSFWRGSDSGLHIAKILKLNCTELRHDKLNYRNEVSVWAGSGSDGGRNLTLFDYPKPLCLFFSGGYGDVVWDLCHRSLVEPRGGLNEMLCEFRLIEGLFITVVPWWGIRQINEIQKISHSDEMKSWVMGSDYDRPIARRIIEEAGIPRGSFAKRKKNTASNNPFWWPSTKIAHEKFNRYLVEHDMRPRSRFEVKLISIFCVFIKLINSNILKFVPENKKWKPWLKFRERDMLFVWANHVLRDEYYK